LLAGGGWRRWRSPPGGRRRSPAAPARSGRQPPGQLCAAHHARHPGALPPACQGLPARQARRAQDRPRSSPRPQAAARQRRHPAHVGRPPTANVSHRERLQPNTTEGRLTKEPRVDLLVGALRTRVKHERGKFRSVIRPLARRRTGARQTASPSPRVGYPRATAELHRRIMALAETPPTPYRPPKSASDSSGCQPACHVIVQRARSRARVTALCVDPGLRRSGIGRHLLTVVDAAGERRGCGAVELTSSPYRHGAHPFCSPLPTRTCRTGS
jgi:ribosomal protein S18 acetylase RimI-like enzyme